jgi:hypothetical protein
VNDSDLDVALRGAVRHDPSRAAGVLQDVGPDLLEEIMHTPDLFEPHHDGDPRTTPEIDLPAGPPARSGRPRRAMVAAVAAAVVLAVAVPAYALRNHPSGHRPVTATPAARPAATSSGSPALKNSATGTRVLVDQAGWSFGSVEQDAPKQWETDLSRQGVTLEITSSPTRASGDQGPSPEPGATWTPTSVPVLDTHGLLDREEATDWVVSVSARGEDLRIRAFSVTKAGFLRLVSKLRWADEETFDAALPARVVSPARELSVAKEMLSDVPLPPGMRAQDTVQGYTNDRYQFGAHVTGTVVCRWIALDLQARAAGDHQARMQADDAMAGSRKWAILREMAPEGGWAQVVWDYADVLTKGAMVPGGSDHLTVAGTYKDAFGCS